MTAKCCCANSLDSYRIGLQWDETLTSELSGTWNNFTSSLPALAKIKLSRALQLSSNSNIEIHGFSDASERGCGYAAVVYVRCSQPNDDVIFRQVLAKTRVAPLKRVTLSHLELLIY